VPGEEFYSYEDKYVTDGAQLLIPAPLPDHEVERVRARVEEAARELLANPVIEDFEVRLP
jgi:D-alanine-D-alanine ligase-like ATP-grasp enzyme